MARPVNRSVTVSAETPAAPITVFYTGGYTRKSLEDKELFSIENQNLLVKNYIEEMPDLTFRGIFSDNGQTGTNFHRPGFERLMEEVRKGRINCIVVKDLSRFGRDYMEAGNFLEIIFPRLGVRFISINDHYDSFAPVSQNEGISIALKNMINAFYSKDISKKISSAYAIKRENGEFVGKLAPFGYLKSPDNVNKLVVDEEAAEIVRLIFRMKLDGFSVNKIVGYLSKQRIPAPGHYRYIKGIHREKRYENLQAWDYSVVRFILESVVYIGHLALGKTRINAYGKQVDVPKEEWVIKKNTHPAIVAQSDFDTVQAQLLRERERYDSLNRHNRDVLPENLLKGLAFCSDCGRTYRRIPSTMRDNKTYRLTYICPHCNKNSPKYTYLHFRQKDLYGVVYTIIRKQLAICADMRNDFNKINASEKERSRKEELELELRQAQNRLERIPLLKMKLYDDFCEGIVSEGEYKLLCLQYDSEKETLSSLREQLLSDIEETQPGFVDNNKWVSAAEKFTAEPELTREMLLALVERIDVGGDLTVKIKFRYRDEYSRIAGYIAEKGGGLYE